MIGIVIATHGSLSKGLLESAELLVGSQTNVKTCGLFHGDDIMGFTETIKEQIKAVDEGDGVLVFADVFGGSPCNSTMMQLKEMDFYCLTGVNLPMLLEAFISRGNDKNTAKDLYEKCYEASVEGIKKINDLI